MTEQKSNVDESSNSPVSKRKKHHSTPSDDKRQHLTTISNTSLETGVVLNGPEPLLQLQAPTADQQLSKYSTTFIIMSNI